MSVPPAATPSPALQRGLETVKQAVDADARSDAREATYLYDISLTYFREAMLYEKTPELLNVIRLKIDEYSQRSSDLKAQMAAAAARGPASTSASYSGLPSVELPAVGAASGVGASGSFAALPLATAATTTVIRNMEVELPAAKADLAVANQAIDTAKREEEATDYRSAFGHYLFALDCLKLVFETSPAAETRTTVQTLMAVYLDRAEKLKQILANGATLNVRIVRLPPSASSASSSSSSSTTAIPIPGASSSSSSSNSSSQTHLGVPAGAGSSPDRRGSAPPAMVLPMRTGGTGQSKSSSVASFDWSKYVVTENPGAERMGSSVGERLEPVRLENEKTFWNSREKLAMVVTLDNCYCRCGDRLVFHLSVVNDSPKVPVERLRITLRRIDDVRTKEGKLRKDLAKLDRQEFNQGSRFPLKNDKYLGDIVYRVPMDLQPTDTESEHARTTGQHRQYEACVQCLIPGHKNLKVHVPLKVVP